VVGRAEDLSLDEEQAAYELPDGVQVAPGVDMDAADPALVDEPFKAGRSTSVRRCVAVRRSGDRCGGAATNSGILCAIHDGRASPLQGALARGAAIRKRAAEAEAVLQLQRLGTRAVVAQALTEKATQVRLAVHHLADAAAGGDLAAAKALIPYLDQALGKPTERVQTLQPASLQEIEALDSSQLAALVAEGRAERLRLVEQPDEASRARTEQ
jgi:hypothetical protein